VCPLALMFHQPKQTQVTWKFGYSGDEGGLPNDPYRISIVPVYQHTFQPATSYDLPLTELSSIVHHWFRPQETYQPRAVDQAVW